MLGRLMARAWLPLALLGLALLVPSVVRGASVASAPVEGAPVEKEPEKPRTTQSADCQLCYEGASGLELAVPLWLPLVGVQAEAEGAEADAKQRITLDSQLEFAIVAEATLRLGPMGLGLSANGVSLGSQVVRSETGTALGNVELDAYFGRATLNWYTPPYRFASGARTELLAIWPYLGVRYAVISGSGASADGKLLLDGTESWAEPLYGARILVDLRRGWLFEVSGDVGGFSVGTEISVWTAFRAQYAATNWLNFHVGWTLYYARIPPSEGVTELLLQGPAVGFGVPLF